MASTHQVGDIAFGVLILAGFFIMVRPNSQGPTLVSNITNGFGSVINAATGGGGWGTPAKK